METSSSPVKKNAVKISNRNLPEEIVTDIISRLPVKRVFQAQCLSKNFSSITTDPKFVEAHLKHSARHRPAIILNRWQLVYAIRCSSGQVTVEEIPLHRGIQFPKFDNMMIVGSCDGLVVLAVADKTNVCFLWNPATTQSNRLPVPSGLPYTKYVSVVWGIGYCTESGVYKIVRLGHTHRSSDDQSLINYAEVFSCGTDRSWRRLDFGEFDTTGYINGTTVKGIVYWETFKRRLLAFDLAKEKFSWVFHPLPTHSRIIEFKGTLAMCCSSEDDKSYDLWVRKDGFDFDSLSRVDDECSWEKIYTVMESESNSYCPIRILDDRQLLLLGDGMKYDGDELEDFTCILCDLESKEIKQIPCLTYGLPVVHNFAESLVPLYASENSSSDHDIDNNDEGIDYYDYSDIDHENFDLMDSDDDVA